MGISFPSAGGDLVDLAEFTEELLKDIAEEIARLLEKAKRGEFDELRALPGYVRQLREVFQLVQEERSRVEKLRKQVAGIVGTGELDFQSARDEIGSRLARLRDAGPG
jgi:hypothetical protein